VPLRPAGLTSLRCLSYRWGGQRLCSLDPRNLTTHATYASAAKRFRPQSSGQRRKTVLYDARSKPGLRDVRQPPVSRAAQGLAARQPATSARSAACTGPQLFHIIADKAERCSGKPCRWHGRRRTLFPAAVRSPSDVSTRSTNRRWRLDRPGGRPHSPTEWKSEGSGVALLTSVLVHGVFAPCLANA